MAEVEIAEDYTIPMLSSDPVTKNHCRQRAQVTLFTEAAILGDLLEILALEPPDRPCVHRSGVRQASTMRCRRRQRWLRNTRSRNRASGGTSAHLIRVRPLFCSMYSLKPSSWALDACWSRRPQCWWCCGVCCSAGKSMCCPAALSCCSLAGDVEDFLRAQYLSDKEHGR